MNNNILTAPPDTGRIGNVKKDQSPLLPLIRRCQKERGLKSEVLRWMGARGIPGNWANLSEWLHPIPKKRRVPMPETLKAMMAIQEEI